MKVKILTLCIFIAFINFANAGEMYNCIDRDGNKIFTDIPQDGMKCALQESSEVNSPPRPVISNNKIKPAIKALKRSPLHANADEISEADMGTYVILGRNNEPVDMFYRISKSGDKWVMDGKKPGESWKNISCDNGCDYSKATHSEIITYFPVEIQAIADIACIKNIAQAFCKHRPKGDSTEYTYVVMALVTGSPIPILLRRVNP